MKTDELFYELFKIDPKSLFRLVRLKLEGEYTFESITVKTAEKRIDGYSRRTDGVGPNVFAEFQGWDDPNIYWRSFREVCMFHEATGATVPFVLIIVFIDPKYDPGNPPMDVEPPNQFIRINLSDALNGVKQSAGILTVLKPLVSNKSQIVDMCRNGRTKFRPYHFRKQRSTRSSDYWNMRFGKNCRRSQNRRSEICYN